MAVSWQAALALSAECGFAASALLPATPVQGFVPNAEAEKQRIVADPAALLDGAVSVLVAAMPFAWHTPWRKGFAEVSAFYFSSQMAHEAIAKLAARLAELGARVSSRQNMPQKVLGQRAGFGSLGRNTLLGNEAWGSCFTLRTLVTDIPPQPGFHPVPPFPALSCGECRRCVDACPTGALDGLGNLRTERCLRTYMMAGVIVPEWLRGKMGTRLLGCEICQRACPRNEGLPAVAPREDCFAMEALLAGVRQDLDDLGRAIGWNEARLGRVRAQAALAAGNSGDARYRPMLRSLADQPDPVVAAHAAWALKQFRKGE